MLLLLLFMHSLRLEQEQSEFFVSHSLVFLQGQVRVVIGELPYYRFTIIDCHIVHVAPFAPLFTDHVPHVPHVPHVSVIVNGVHE